MAIDPSVITMSGILKRPRADWECASRHIACLPGVVMVEMSMPEATWTGPNGIEMYLPDRYSLNTRPDMGVVIAKGEGRRYGKDVKVDLDLGDVVLVRPDDGLWREGFVVGGYAAQSQVRCYGVFVNALAPGHPELAPWWDSIMAVWNEDGTLTPTHTNTVIRLDPPEEKSAEGFWLSDLSLEYSYVGEVESHGPACECVVRGDRVVLDPNASVTLNLSCFGDHLALANEEGVEAILMSGE